MSERVTNNREIDVNSDEYKEMMRNAPSDPLGVLINTGFILGLAADTYVGRHLRKHKEKYIALAAVAATSYLYNRYQKKRDDRSATPQLQGLG